MEKEWSWLALGFILGIGFSGLLLLVWIFFWQKREKRRDGFLQEKDPVEVKMEEVAQKYLALLEQKREKKEEADYRCQRAAIREIFSEVINLFNQEEAQSTFQEIEKRINFFLDGEEFQPLRQDIYAIAVQQGLANLATEFAKKYKLGEKYTSK